MYIARSFFPVDANYRIFRFLCSLSPIVAPFANSKYIIFIYSCVFFPPLDCELLEGQDLSLFAVPRTWPGP
uniref:SLTP002 n=2 Tax=Hominidae TaxID=9604 RepID=Q8TE08_HUMAN|nr:SLTP002 [Homo sapiens]